VAVSSLSHLHLNVCLKKVLISRYQASLPDELDLRPGMKLKVLRLYDDAWGTAQVVSGGMEGERTEGSFPIVSHSFSLPSCQATPLHRSHSHLLDTPSILIYTFLLLTSLHFHPHLPSECWDKADNQVCVSEGSSFGTPSAGSSEGSAH
jgi:hypothetical protein